MLSNRTHSLLSISCRVFFVGFSVSLSRSVFGRCSAIELTHFSVSPVVSSLLVSVSVLAGVFL